ncbi:phosphatidylserine decarboxylase family protein [bacterium]|nr:phosphatidylserine decarboxylase family protein [bacterium]MBU1152677.1 phosphatidylserine decarboxylase family protein [bacterium]
MKIIRKIPIAKESFPIILPFSIFLVIIYFFSKTIFYSSLPLFLFVIYFFRDPERKILFKEGVILSPADGKITEINEVYEGEYLKQPVYKISIFLSIFNVHINRSPIPGVVEHKKYLKGKFRNALFSDSSLVNENNILVIRSKDTLVLVKQIAGFIARRIICYCEVGSKLTLGERYGMIKFGSRVDIFLPKEISLKCQKGDKVYAGLTIIGEVTYEKNSNST